MRIELRGITFGYGKDIIFDDLSVSFERGSLNVILGPNGVGKTTLVKIMLGILRPWRGEVLIDGRPISKGEVAYLPQHNELFPWLTVRENVELPLKIRGAKDRSAVAEYMKLTGVSHLSDRYPSRLSGGERKRAALARALASESPAIVLDEPTAGVDPGGREAIWAMLRKISGARLIVSVTHDVLEALTFGSRIYVMSGRPARVVEILEGGRWTWEEAQKIVKLYYGA